MGEITGPASPNAAAGGASPEDHVPSAARERPERETIIIRKRGFLWPITAAIGLTIIAVVAIGLYQIVGHSERLYRAHFGTDVHRDASDVRLLSAERSRRMVRDDEIQFILRRGEQGPQRVIVARSAADAFVNTQLNYIDARRRAMKDTVRRDLAALFERVFADREAAVNAYADWFFAWGQSWQLLYQALAGGINELPKVGLSHTKVTEAARIEAERYLMDHYNEFVLKPELRDPKIIAGARRILKKAHDEFRLTLGTLDYRLTQFLEKHTRHTEPITAEDRRRIELDWEAQRWKAPRGAIEGKYREALTSMATIAGSAVILGPVLEATVLPLLGKVVVDVLAGFELTIGGTVLGSEVPFLGNVVGLVVGALADYGLSYFRESMDREAFVEGNRAAIEATMQEWQDKLAGEFDQLIDVWMDDTQAAIALEERQ